VSFLVIRGPFDVVIETCDTFLQVGRSSFRV